MAKRIGPRTRYNRHTEESFWLRTDRQGGVNTCWPFHPIDPSTGYGHLTFQAKRWKAHRLAFTLAKGHIPVNQQICHTCDNKACCNPEHLFLGSSRDNKMDAVVKGIVARKLKPAEVLTIVKLRREGLTHQAIADLLGIPRPTIETINGGYTWSWLTGIPIKHKKQRADIGSYDMSRLRASKPSNR